MKYRSEKKFQSNLLLILIIRNLFVDGIKNLININYVHTTIKLGTIIL